MKTVLCYGDSNTWGYVPLTGDRYDAKTRWPMLLMRILNGGSPESPLSYENPAWWVIEEGLNARTTCREDPVEGDKNGLRQLEPILESHMPLDIVIVMLGTNDLKIRFSPIAPDIANGMLRVVKAVQEFKLPPNTKPPKALVICPPPTVDCPALNPIFAGSPGLSKTLSPFYRACAEEAGAAFLDAGSVISTSAVDGIHFSPESHRTLALKAAEIIKSMA